MSGIVGDNTGTGSGQIATVQGITTSSSDPAVDTNPSGGLGTVWANTSSGEMYACTDITNGSNVWTNMGDGTGDIAPWYVTSASTSYFTVLGHATGYASNTSYDRNAMASDGDSTDWGDMSRAGGAIGCSSSTTHGYASGGYNGANMNNIDKFAMASTSDGTDVGDLTYSGHHVGGVTGDGYGYAFGGWSNQDQINKYSYSSDGNATDVGDTRSSYAQRGGQSETHGYTLGGTTPNNNVISKFTFANNNYSTGIGVIRGSQFVGCTCTADGYVFSIGGGQGTDFIDKMATASDSDAVVTGATLAVAIDVAAGGSNSSTTGYVAGGGVSSNLNQIAKFALNISSGNSVDVGNLVVDRSNTGGCQY